MKKVVLAYSGGLDTSVILHWLIAKGYDVICFVGNVGQKEDFAAVEKKAYQIGAKGVYIEDLREEFVRKYIFQALKADALYEGRYLLGTSLARPLIAKKQLEIAQKENTSILAHGATGKGNDQVRFEMAYLTFMPEATIISPWKDEEFLNQFQGRIDMIEYAEKHGIPISATKKKSYSIDENLMHTSYESGILEDPFQEPPEDMFLRTCSPKLAPDVGCDLMIQFKQGVPFGVKNLSTGESIQDLPLELFLYINNQAEKHGVGRCDLVENRYVGMKSRGVYETPAGTVLWKAHQDLEALVLDKEVFHLKEFFSSKIAQLIYNGFWFSPEMDFLMTAIEKTQTQVEGEVFVHLYKGNVIITKRRSSHSLYNQDLASMDRLGKYDQRDAKGFIKICALRLRNYKEAKI